MLQSAMRTARRPTRSWLRLGLRPGMRPGMRLGLRLRMPKPRSCASCWESSEEESMKDGLLTKSANFHLADERRWEMEQLYRDRARLDGELRIFSYHTTDREYGEMLQLIKGQMPVVAIEIVKRELDRIQSESHMRVLAARDRLADACHTIDDLIAAYGQDSTHVYDAIDRMVKLDDELVSLVDIQRDHPELLDQAEIDTRRYYGEA